MKNKFLEKVSEQIADDKSRELITAELESHLLDKIDYYVDIGYSKEDAEKRATEEMGNPDDTAVPLNALHQNKYRGVFTFICLVAVIALFMATLNASPLFCYVAEYSNLTHYAMFDFWSLIILATYTVMIIYSQKKSHKSVAIFIIISLGFQVLMSAISITLQGSFLLIIKFSSIFQPAVYAIMTTITKGPIAYIDSLFAYENIEYSAVNEWCYTAIPFIIMALLLLWAIAVLIKIRKNERMKGRKVYLKITKVFKNIFIVFLSVNFLIMGICAVISRVEINSKSTEILTEREKIIDFVMNANLKTTSNEFLDNAKANGFDFQLNFKYGKHPTFDSLDKEYVYRHNGNMISVNDINCNMYLSLDYNALNTSIFYDDLLLTTKEVDAINTLKVGDSISKLYEKSLIYKASAISKIYYANDNLGNPKYSLYPCMTFVIDKKGQTYKTIDISVSDGKISNICEPIEHKKEYETGFNFFIRS